MPKKLTRNQITYKSSQFINCENIRQLEHLLQLPEMQLAKDAFNPQYYYFRLRKTGGEYRDIEAPDPYLKRTQRKLNEYLQYVYYTQLTIAAYGFIINPRKQKPKNIVSNASQHIGNRYMLNIDFDDFFHQINQKQVFEIFRNKPFSFNKNIANTLSKICTNKGRLPMGAPTSPALSNFACIGLDIDLQNWATKKDITYTRFVDDLSFSANNPISRKQFNEIKEITDKYYLRIEPTKTKLFGKEQMKIVTGIVVGETNISIAKDYYKELNKDIDRLQKTIEVHIITGQVYKADAINNFKQEIMGKINFIAIVMGYDSPIYETYMLNYENAINPPEKDELSVRWVRFSNYSNF